MPKHFKPDQSGLPSNLVSSTHISSIELVSFFLRKEFGETDEIDPEKVYTVPTFMAFVLRTLTERFTWPCNRSEASFFDVLKEKFCSK